MDEIPAAKGSYLLVSRLRNYACKLASGLWESMILRKGSIFYCGSAQGPGGLRLAIAHHQRTAQKPHWHIDYLKPMVKMLMVWYLTAEIRFECRFVESLIKLPNASQPVRSFWVMRLPVRLFFASRPISARHSHKRRVFGSLKLEFGALNARILDEGSRFNKLSLKSYLMRPLPESEFMVNSGQI